MKKKRIYVRKSDIEVGGRGNCFTCPVAMALKRAYKGRSISVQSDSYRVDRGSIKTGAWFPLPETAVRFVRDFDAGRPVKPFSFTTGGE